ncbi:DUF3267 domain-containing protein [Anaerotignum sp.]|uniref:DUF3267 domain-containing protein n=1 Tax=Anaerotignum sp. TaxID=2039241 RepID=UPI00331D38F0
MKYIKKLPKTDIQLKQSLLESGWKQIKEPKTLGMSILLSLPLSFLLGGFVLWIAYTLNPLLFSFFAPDSLKISFTVNLKTLVYFIAIYFYMLIHEMVHAFFVPNFIKSEKTFFGLNGMFGFVFTTEPMKKNRFLLISVMPFFLLSIVPLFILNPFGILNWYTLGLCLINATGSCVDFLNMLFIGFQVKNNSTIINNGFETYYYFTK